MKALVAGVFRLSIGYRSMGRIISTYLGSTSGSRVIHSRTCKRVREERLRLSGFRMSVA